MIYKVGKAEEAEKEGNLLIRANNLHWIGDLLMKIATFLANKRDF